ncbi:helix-turn-helix domain-containing protein [Umezawaea sp. Da 62-37]|uniref:TetR/AcrR family transcriptional regulator n=1 Tax=Umezawaea sp. Da 62-37 TaxID=3075927 RepID=UPI0028F72B3E|nr:helix-turn-helix domain-containing protein [Umezawaea sp. Da 62-37]WNV85911.1 helix-turn-helix domain-containing protein [Umezawaea sp. Da 62-37]
MGRWEPDARDRLKRAAVDLFVEQGFAETTVPQITARAGLTTRTFFRHFADKREVLFVGEEEFPAMVAGLMADAPAELGPMAVILHGLQTVSESVFEGQQDYLRTRRSVIRMDEGLRERELWKMSALSESIRKGFLERGVDELTATLAAQAGVAAFTVGIARWLDQDTATLAEIVRDTLRALRAVVSELPS